MSIKENYPAQAGIEHLSSGVRFGPVSASDGLLGIKLLFVGFL